MAIGIDEDFIDEVDDLDQEHNEEPSDGSEGSQDDQTVDEEPDDSSGQQNEEQPPSSEEKDFISQLLESRGISDKSKIKFENEDGEVEEVKWDDLSDSDKLNVLNTSETNPETDLDSSEIELINAIRTSGLSPAEYLDQLGMEVVNQYVQNTSEPTFEIDQYSDDELFLMDLMSRSGDITEDEALEALDRAKSNEDLYKKQVSAIRSEYKKVEQENQMQEQAEQEQIAQQQYEQFSNQIVDEINNLTEIQGFDLNLNSEDMQNLYDFITGEDAAGNNYLAKALSDPQVLVKTAWLALNGDQMVSDITNYFQKEISNVRKASYKKGVEDTQKKMNSNNVVYRENKMGSKEEVYDDLD